MLGVHQLVTRPTVLAGMPQPHLQTHLPNRLPYPVLLAWMVIILRLFPKILGFISLLGSTSMTLTMSSSVSKRQEECSWVGKWTSVYQRLWLWVIAALMRDVTLRIARFRRLWIGQTEILSQRFKVS